ncbi:hypothetical protein JOF41_002243 [Saccharothrix coeruleofusca]|uniref:hypothetical protein n=1 Tax=Saccharothrix coeruleofusca TaxID=33919 RepID=UPI001AE1E827|nr:hypothetical protein [Saccharothrix coeruleofusca]MBP2336065.1 hypothetical protein [Saccharothrix coeruleofusca]
MSIEEPTGRVNWEAYSHEELYRMVWQDADVADVGAIAAEWGWHRDALEAHAEVLREQRAALLDGWRGRAAEEAADRLDALAAGVERIGELARAGQRAAQEAAEALATARAMMPPPPATTTPSFTTPPAPPAAPNYAGVSAPTLSASGPGAAFGAAFGAIGTAFGAVGGAGFSFYFGAIAADQGKAEAVRAMRAYETTLTGCGRLIDAARTGAPPPAPLPRTDPPPVDGVPWTRLLGSTPVRPAAAGRDPVACPITGGATGAVVSGPAASDTGRAAPLGAGSHSGVLTGVLTGAVGGAGTPTGHPAGPSTARAATGQVGALAPAGSRPGDTEDEPHENRMPTIDHELFDVEQEACPAVIGETTGARL